jgi:hypothetical protein
MKHIKESDVEAYLVRCVEARGGTAEKFSSPSKRNVPDRLICWPWTDGGKYPAVEFVECKAPGKEATAAQERDHERRRKMGFPVYVVNSIERVNLYMECCNP